MKITKIETLQVDEPAYDLSVKSANHNFELSNGVFVHNSLKVPKQFFGFCLRGDTQIPLLNGETVAIRDLYNNKSNYLGKGVMGCAQDGSLKPTKIKNVMLTKPEAAFIRVHLNNGSYVDVTPEHRMMLRNGAFIPAEELKIGDSLMPYYCKIKDGRKYILDNKKGSYKAQFRIVAEAEFPNIEKDVQVHHVDGDKTNDDFDNLIPLTVADHYAVHFDYLHDCARKANSYRKENDIPRGNVGYKIINNGEWEAWLKPDEALPNGFEFGRLPFSQDTKDKMSTARLKTLAEHPEYKKLGGYAKGEATEETIKNLKAGRANYFNNLSDEARQEYHDKHADAIKANKDKMLTARMAKRELIDPDHIKRIRNLRCPYCGKIFQLKLNNIEFKEYLASNKLYYCCTEHYKELNGGGKLLRSYKLYQKSNCDLDMYDFNRKHSPTNRQDFYFTSEVLESKLQYMFDYVPEVNHVITAIEYLDIIEPAYDIEVEDDCHTFALDCGVFVHNCDDGAGFNGGQSLTILSARYGKSIKNYQNILTQTITTLLNLFLIDRGLDNYVNRFTVRMQPPVTQEELDRRTNTDNRINYIGNVMQQMSDIQDPVVKLKIYSSLLGTTINDPSVMGYLQNYIKDLEKQAEAAKAGNAEEGAPEESSDLPPLESLTAEESKTTINEEGADEDKDEYIPSADELGIDLLSDM